MPFFNNKKLHSNTEDMAKIMISEFSAIFFVLPNVKNEDINKNQALAPLNCNLPIQIKYYRNSRLCECSSRVHCYIALQWYIASLGGSCIWATISTLLEVDWSSEYLPSTKQHDTH